MYTKLRLRASISAVIVISAGSLMHFAWEWSGQNNVIALFAAVNESTWEHLKLAFWPALLLTPFQYKLYGAFPGWPIAVTIRCILPSVLIVLFFYGYTAILGSHYLVADLIVFAGAIFIGEFFGHSLLPRQLNTLEKVTALGALILVTVLFSIFTLWPPDFFLFNAP